MLLFLLSLGGIPFVAGFWAKLYVFLAGVERGLLGAPVSVLVPEPSTFARVLSSIGFVGLRFRRRKRIA
jgi:formate hydrogenlyase subunit 3/multisubunit Na+/H+ antiporter MnhD subunit